MLPWQLITPDLVLSQSIAAITPELMQKHGLRGMILDVDDTIVGNHESEASPEIKVWIDLMRQDYPIWLISNNFSNRRIQNIAENLDLPFRSRAGKPSRRMVRQALEAMKLPPEQVAMIGDRLFTDTLVGNRLGLFTVLVQPPCNNSDKGDNNKKTSLLRVRTNVLRSWEIWLARKSGVNI
ncbi:YqeG family HAD IIIA-type phosphatase [Tumidithrix elongata RA019]|uniref:YqeG family HAD IIIA-type phosphatase n=1 Tax=Tumidithrix elongata BACA0141 TaxID=2716417 RepID=A0AAW9PXG9_9CYAN|nr:YqeG family HAD IIIA-type phosphatase [Tumidithrix elongata RA019]